MTASLHYLPTVGQKGRGKGWVSVQKEYKPSKWKHAVTFLADPEIKVDCGCANSCTSATVAFTPEQISASTHCYLSQVSDGHSSFSSSGEILIPGLCRGLPLTLT